MNPIVARITSIISCCSALAVGSDELETYITAFQQKASACKTQQASNKHNLKQCVQSKSLYTFLAKQPLTGEQKQRVTSISTTLSIDEICNGLFEKCMR